MRYDERPAWRALLGWPDDCEEGFQRFEHEPGDAGCVSVYPVAEGQYLAFVTCNVGPYWVEERVYWLDYRAGPPIIHPIAIPELIRHDAPELGLHEVDMLHGAFPDYHPDTQTLTNLHAYRGLKDCGVFYKYHLEDEGFVLDEARYRDCGNLAETDITALNANEWPLVYPPPATNGPYLIYKKSVNGQQMLVIVDADGDGRREQPLPASAVAEDLANTVSPDGQWLAFYTGSAEVRSGAGCDLALNLMDLSNGQTRLLTPLLSADYPDNFRQAADILSQQGITLVEGIDQSVILREAFVHGIHSLAWSPDGRYLAFAGQMDGLSSDLYVYDIETQTIQRLSDGPEQIQSITWSPDGRWILHGSANIVGEGIEIHYHAAAVDGSSAVTLSSSIMHIWGWIAPSTYLQSDANNGPAGTYNLQSVDIESGAIETLWGGTFHSFAIDPANDTLAVVGFESVGQEGTPPALFLVDLSNGSVRKVKEAVASVEFIGVVNKRFIAADGNETFFVMADGSLTETGFSASRIKVSPHLRYLLVLGEKLQVYTWDNNLVREIALARPASSIDRVIWRPDSPGIFFTFGSQMYAVNLLAGEPYLVDENVPERWELDHTFIETQKPGFWLQNTAFLHRRDSQEQRCCYFSTEKPGFSKSVR